MIISLKKTFIRHFKGCEITNYNVRDSHIDVYIKFNSYPEGDLEYKELCRKFNLEVITSEE